MVGRLVPVGSDWLMSGIHRSLRRSERDAAYRLACKLSLSHPELVFRNPRRLDTARAQVCVEHDRFIRFFGEDLVVLPGAELFERMAAFYEFCRAEAGASPQGMRQPEYPDELTSDEVAVLHDDIAGVSFYHGFGMVSQTFADPSLLRHPDYRRHMRGYLDDDSVPPLLFRRRAARDPERASQVFRRLLGRKNFDWAVGGEALLRRRKPTYFQGPQLPSMIPLSDKLAPYVASA